MSKLNFIGSRGMKINKLLWSYVNILRRGNTCLYGLQTIYDMNEPLKTSLSLIESVYYHDKS